MKIAQLQSKVCIDKKDTLEQISGMINSVDIDTDIIMLPEMFCCPYDTALFEKYAESDGGNTYQLLSEIANKENKYIVAGSMPESDDGHLYNTSYVFDRNGNCIGKHRKVHLFDIDVKNGQYFKESDTLSSGNQITVFDTEFCKCGLCICYDFRFPVMGRIMALNGAKVIFVPAAFNMTTGPAHWEIMFRSQALNNQVYAVGTAPARDMSASYHSYGHSIITDPWGSVISQIDEKQGIKITEIDLEKVEQVREQLPLLKHRREEIYRK